MKAVKYILKLITICLCKNTHTYYVDGLLFKEKFWFKKNLLSNIALYICTTASYHSSVDGPLGCFRVLAIVKSAAMNIGIHASFSVMVFSWYVTQP